MSAPLAIFATVAATIVALSPVIFSGGWDLFTGARELLFERRDRARRERLLAAAAADAQKGGPYR